MKENTSEEELTIDTLPVQSQKRHKKHKHKKHKKRKISHDSEIIESPKKFIKTSPIKEEDRGTSTSPKVAKRKLSKNGKGKDSGTSSEEERWLDAIESGKLEEVDDELKKIKPKDPKLMTARQRAMFERKTDTEPNPGVEQLMSLPTGYKEKVMTAEAIQKAALKSLKRKQLADEKREKDKKKTMERLLKKQESKISKGKGKAKRQVPLVTYRLTINGCSISLPPGEDFFITSSKSKEIPPPIYCAIGTCKNLKRYSCSKTNVPLCSLECYKAHLADIMA